jgi:cytochrome c oxidase subunit 2
MLDIFSVPEVVSTYAADVDGLYNLVRNMMFIPFVLAEVLIIFMVLAYRKKDGVKAKYIGGDTPKQLMIIFIPLVFFVGADIVIDIATHRVWHKVKIDRPEIQDNVQIIGQQWTWSFMHSGKDGKLGTADDIETYNELHIKKDVNYGYDLQSKDVLHNFGVPVFRLKQDAIPGRAISGWFNAMKAGEYGIECAEMCGAGHGTMGARLFVHEPADFDQWVAENSPEEEEEEDMMEEGSDMEAAPSEEPAMAN